MLAGRPVFLIPDMVQVVELDAIADVVFRNVWQWYYLPEYGPVHPLLLSLVQRLSRRKTVVRNYAFLDASNDHSYPSAKPISCA